jgi:transposase
VYHVKEPETVIRIKAEPPLQATAYELEKLRCNACQAIFKAPLPVEAGLKKYDETAGAMIGLLRYGSGFPFKRLENLQAGLGVPLPASTQWDVAEQTADKIYPAYDELLRQSAAAELVHNDDTPMKVLELMQQQDDADNNPKKPSRTGIFTTGIIAKLQEHTIALFFTGGNHAGENMSAVLKHRQPGLPPPIQMCDALSRNLPKEFKIILANCLTHGRRNFVDVYASFPEQCRYVIETLADIYKHDAATRQQALSADERLAYHRAHSGPLMEALHQWLNDQLQDKLAEPNSGLGQAIKYMLNHWKALTQFLRVPGAPLDNNSCERALKRAILHRKNSLFYKTEHGAYIGDLFMSLIHTCHLSQINPFDYLVNLQRYSAEVFKNPGNWLPWTSQQTLAALTAP